MSAVAWILSVILALAFTAAGAGKLAQSREKLIANPNMAWAADFSNGMVKAIGSLEILGAIGIIFPWLLDIARVLTPLAAVGFILLMVGAMATHLRRGERQVLAVNGVLLIMAAIVAVVRFGQL